MLFDILLLTFVALAAVSILYSTIKLGISPMPSSKKAYHAMMELVDETGSGAIIDLGSGWGNFVIRIAKKNPQRQVIGYELSLLPWFITTLLKSILGLKNLTLHRQDFYKVELPAASVLVCYLFPRAMVKINNKLVLEQPNINFLISNNFALSSYHPYKTIALKDFYKSPVYLYKIS
jgi:16S rRNA A1518/A1519 N6-dimethyltransferase RsmA/KsgA/DIM1 with predicted DNA glycosylase/AP lyase activity